MAETTYDLVFRAELLPEGDGTTARATLARLLKLDDGRLQQLFSGGVVFVRRGADRETAVRFQAAFRQAGARLRVLPVESAQVESAQVEAAPVDVARAAPPAAAVAAPEPPRRMSLSERLAAQQAAPIVSAREHAMASAQATLGSAGDASTAAESEPDRRGTIDFVPSSAEDRAIAAALAAAAAEAESARTGVRSAELLSASVATHAGAQVDGIAFTLAPVGADLIDEDEREIVSGVWVETDHIDLAPPGGLIPVLHPRADIRPSVKVPDFDVAEAGALLAVLTEFVEVDIDLDAYSLAPLGAQLGATGSLAQAAEADVLMRLDHLKLAPVGSDLRAAPSA